MQKKLNDKILNHLRFGKTAEGRVGCVVKPTEWSSNKAWISVGTKKGFDVRTEPTKEYVISYEVEYIELSSEYTEEEHGMDFDLFLVKRENYYNVKEIDRVEAILHKWIDDFTSIEPILNLSYPI